MNIVYRIKERSELAAIYAGDGGLHSAARILRDLTDEIDRLAAEKDALLQSIMAARAAPDTNDEGERS